MRRYVGLGLMLVLFAAGSVALAGTGDKPVLWQFDLGYSMPQGEVRDWVKDGWTVGFDAVLKPNPKRGIGWRFGLSYDWWDVDPDAVRGGIKADDGDGNQWALKGGLQWETPGDRIKFVGGLGVGGYRVHANISEEVLIPGYICDPFYWWYCYPGLVPGSIILADETLTKFGYYGTAAISFPLQNSDIYVEVQYHAVDVTHGHFETLPIVIGWRF